MSRSTVEVADIFRASASAWRQHHAGHISLDQLKVMSAIERCRTVALGGHVLHCTDCGHTAIAYNSCRNRHCPKCQASAAKRWLMARQHELLPVDYYHVVFTLPAPLRDIASQNKAVVYGILFKAAAKTLLTIAADAKHLGARLGLIMVLHTWGSALTHHPHVHCIVPGGGISLDGQQWMACKPGFFLPVRVLSRLFRRLFLQQLHVAAIKGELKFYGQLQPLNQPEKLSEWLAPVSRVDWVVYAKRPFAGPDAVLAYLSRYTHRVAIANSRLISFDEQGVTFKWKDYRLKGRYRPKTMTLATDEFIRRFLLHVLPGGFHRIRHYGLFANPVRATNLTKMAQLLASPLAKQSTADDEDVNDGGEVTPDTTWLCPCCKAPMLVIEVLARSYAPRAPPQPLRDVA